MGHRTIANHLRHPVSRDFPSEIGNKIHSSGLGRSFRRPALSKSLARVSHKLERGQADFRRILCYTNGRTLFHRVESGGRDKWRADE